MNNVEDDASPSSSQNLASSLWAPTLHYGIISKGNYTIRARNVAAAIGIRVVLQVVSTARISVARHACDVELCQACLLVRHACN